MSDNLSKKVLLIGAGQMAVDYCLVLKALNCHLVVVGRGQKSAELFENKTGVKVVTGGLESFLKTNTAKFDAAIVAVGMEELAPTTIQLINNHFDYILVEKPAGLTNEQIDELAGITKQHHANVLVAYNRRFYASVVKAKEIIKEDGGVLSFNFEFTEWAHTIEPLQKKPGIKENWLLANSTHVIDLAFYLGGKPKTMSGYVGGSLSWHNKAIFSGAGKTHNDTIFSYQANWTSPGRWGVEILTAKSRLIFRPLEELQVQLNGSVAIHKIEINDAVDKKFKPGLYLQVEKFLKQDLSEFKTIQEQADMLTLFNMIANGTDQQ